MDKIDLDAIIKGNFGNRMNFGSGDMKIVMREAIHQALVLASQKVKLINEPSLLIVDRLSILDIEKLVV